MFAKNCAGAQLLAIVDLIVSLWLADLWEIFWWKILEMRILFSISLVVGIWRERRNMSGGIVIGLAFCMDGVSPFYEGMMRPVCAHA